MLNKKVIIIVLSLLSIILLIALIILSRYCSCELLKFNSSEFNNIATPIISFFGVIGLLVTIFLSQKQIRYSKSDQYFKDFQLKFDKISKEQNSELMFPNVQILNFFDYVDKAYNELIKEFPEYLTDLEEFKNGKIVTSDNKRYSGLLGNVILFSTQSVILHKELLTLIKEIENHKQLVFHHKDLLLDNLISGLISGYLSACWLIDEEYSYLIEDFYIAFHQVGSDKLKFFNKDFYELRNYIFSKEGLKRYKK